MKKLFAALSVLSLAIFLVGCRIEVSTNSWQDNARFIQSNVMVQLNHNCSGVIIDKTRGLIATAWHCVQGNEKKVQIAELTKYNEDGTEDSVRKLFGYVLKEDSSVDVAIIKLNDGTPLCCEAKLSTSVVRKADHVFIVGNPNAWKGYITDGIVVQNNLVWDIKTFDGLMHRPNFKMLLVSAQIAPGSSGGPVFNDRGELIGLSNWAWAFFYTQYSISERMSGVTPVDNIRKVLKEVKL